VVSMVIGVHVGCGVVAVLGGAGAMLARKGGRRHRWLGRLHLLALTGLGITAPILAASDWAHRWHLVVLGGLATAASAAGFTAVRLARPARVGIHITGMGTGYVVMLTAFYVDNGPRLPLWDQLPPVALWLLPTVIGAPIVLRAWRRHRPAGRGGSG
jgi:uncharacterized membrane protein